MNGYCFLARLRRLSYGETSTIAVPAGRELYRDAAAEAASEDHDASRVDVLALGELVINGERVGDQGRLARTPFAQPVATVVEGGDRPGCERFRVVDVPGNLLRVAAEVDQQTVGRRRLHAVAKPAVQSRPVACRHLDLGRGGQLSGRVPNAVRQRLAQKDEVFLQQVEHRAQRREHPETGVQERQHRRLDQFAVLATGIGSTEKGGAQTDALMGDGVVFWSRSR